MLTGNSYGREFLIAKKMKASTHQQSPVVPKYSELTLYFMNDREQRNVSSLHMHERKLPLTIPSNPTNARSRLTIVRTSTAVPIL
jgi:hypothetical protein